jgi:hypothetical protein
VFPALAADPTPFAAVRGVLEELAPQLPPGLSPTETSWKAWSKQHGAEIRARLDQGDLDSMVNLLLFGTSFTTQPRMNIDTLAEQTRAGILRARLDDLLRGLNSPGKNERLALVRRLVDAKKSDKPTGTFILENLQRVLNERAAFAARSERQFRDRGVSLDTTILPNLAIEAALQQMKMRGLLRAGQVVRAAVIGPGLDFTDKESGYDFYPQQTLQPFALYDSLKRLGLGTARPTVTVFDISPRVLDHLRQARGKAYTVQLPRETSATWTPEAVAYWRTFGDQIGVEAPPIGPPELLQGIETRSVRIRAEVVQALEPADLNLIVETRLNPPFDLIIATNTLVYYDLFDQALALSNISAMLKPGGFLLTNDELPVVRAIPMQLVDRTTVTYTEQPRYKDTVFWYQRR